ncbi:cysteine desulfurase [Peteryoungia desertarenae]|uniref:Cysteine desulfurase n=1 Tax=Peteryoungia desertarenae TaxID=1813451 RepID=A0ABX6QQV4_9HYPH|nr:cysteine desulfurase family protein [Peteryoungia desertarenae]QLF70642.1 cysteine desulfurase [Peteryoungia desertarenae]
MAKERIYLDWNATAPLLGDARNAMLAALDLPGNPSSVHAEGRAARGVIEQARREVAALIGARSANVVFAASATEAANLVLSPVYMMGRAEISVGHLLVSAIEHPAVRTGGRFSPEQMSEIRVERSGVIDLEALEAALSAHDASSGIPMVAVMLANNETGIIQPIQQIAEIVRKHRGLLVVDAVQAVGRMAVDIEALGADFLILSAHKLGGPKGAGALVSRGETLMPAPLVRGGGQEKGHRAGTENLAAIAGFGAACRVMAENLVCRNEAIEQKRDRLEEALQRIAPDIVIYGRGVSRIANTSFFHLPGMKAETGQIAFDIEGIALSAGAACSSGKVGASHVLTAMGEDAATGALRISLGPTTTVQDIDTVIAAFSKIAGRRRLSGKAA